MLPDSFHAQRLGKAFLAEDWTLPGLSRRGQAVVGRRNKWLMPLVEKVLARWPVQPPLLRDLMELITTDKGLIRREKRGRVDYSPLLAEPAMRTVPPFVQGSLPQLHTSADLADWLGISASELDWLADLQGRNRHVAAGKLQHYRYAWVRKRHGTARLIESPKPRLKAIQRTLLRELLDHVPVHPAAHGFRAGRSVKTFVAAHVARQAVLRMDLRDFFPSIASSRVSALFLALGYPELVARLLAGLCTNRLPTAVLDNLPPELAPLEARRLASLYGQRHLPQGAPTSPALANLCAYQLDCRLSGLAKAAGGQYTRYADDLLFSGQASFARGARRFHTQAAAIALEEGFAVHFRKTRIMRPAVRQHCAGLTLNVLPNIRRQDYDRLKATLHRCRLHGPAAENRQNLADFRAYLAGRIGYVAMVHPARGEKLLAAFQRIAWPVHGTGDESTDQSR
ncbi:MAG: reverse transcriptase family protein [Pirellulales bacterium]